MKDNVRSDRNWKQVRTRMNGKERSGPVDRRGVIFQVKLWDVKKPSMRGGVEAWPLISGTRRYNRTYRRACVRACVPARQVSAADRNRVLYAETSTGRTRGAARGQPGAHAPSKYAAIEERHRLLFVI